MRRGLNNKISILLIIVVGVFTIFSYLFDQLVIREEDNFRITQIKFENLNTKITKLNSISTQLTTAYDSSIVRTINLKRFKNYWLKSILLITNYDELELNLKDQEIVKSFNDNPKYLADLVKSRNIDHFKGIVFAINEQVDRLHNIYGWNLNFFPQYEDGDYYNGPDIEYSKIFDQNKDIFYEKNFNTYADLAIDDIKRAMRPNVSLTDSISLREEPPLPPFHVYSKITHKQMFNLVNYLANVEANYERIAKDLAETKELLKGEKENVRNRKRGKSKKN